MQYVFRYILSIITLLVVWSLPIGAQQSNVQAQQTTPQTEGWVSVQNPTTKAVYSLSQVYSNIVWAAAEDGLLKSTDAGLTWKRTQAPAIGEPYFTSQLDGYLAGDKVYRTTDGGEQWDTLSSGLVSASGFTTIGRDTAFTLWLPYISRTIDGGKSWKVTEVPASGLRAISFCDSKNGGIVGNRTLVLKDSPAVAACYHTIDGGEHWDPLYTGVQHRLNTLKVLDSTTYVAGSVEGYIARTTDGGRSWKETQVTEIDWGIQNLAFRKQREGFACGGKGVILYTSDGGETWAHRDAPTTNTLYAIAIIDSVTLVVTGDNGVIFRTTNAGVSWVKDRSAKAQLLTQLYPQPINGMGQLSFDLPEEQRVSITIYDLTGHEVQRLLHNQPLPQGRQSLPLLTSMLPVGSYQYTIESEKYLVMNKFNVVR